MGQREKVRDKRTGNHFGDISKRDQCFFCNRTRWENTENSERQRWL